jgi:hypothetical protein
MPGGRGYIGGGGRGHSLPSTRIAHPSHVIAHRLARVCPWDTGRAMSQKNVELAAQVMDALGRRDLSRVIALTDPEVKSTAGWMLKFRHGRVICFRAFREPEQALEAVGLGE